MSAEDDVDVLQGELDALTKRVADFLTWLAEQKPCCSCCGGDDEFMTLVRLAKEKLGGK